MSLVLATGGRRVSTSQNVSPQHQIRSRLHSAHASLMEPLSVFSASAAEAFSKDLVEEDEDESVAIELEDDQSDTITADEEADSMCNPCERYAICFSTRRRNFTEHLR